MLLAKRSQYDFLVIYTALIDECIESNNSQLRGFFKQIFGETKKLVNDNISYYEVDSEIYPLVSYLKDRDSKFFKDLDLKTITNEELEEVKKFLTSTETAK